MSTARNYSGLNIIVQLKETRVDFASAILANELYRYIHESHRQGVQKGHYKSYDRLRSTRMVAIPRIISNTIRMITIPSSLSPWEELTLSFRSLSMSCRTYPSLAGGPHQCTPCKATHIDSSV